SPYLLQHAHNPVNWKPWNDKTLAKAKKEEKLMIVSIGYAACHWCHVMEHESFEDSTVAAIMNADFIPIKVDREEQPDVDQIYINAIQLMTGSAGWPLNVITLPDGRPVWGGTYFKKEEWINAIAQIQEVYKTEPQKLKEYAARLEQGLASLDLIEVSTADTNFKNFNAQPLLATWKKTLDTVNGGSRGAPKFMMPNQLEFLLREAVKNNNTALMQHVERTLKKMAYGGLYDQVGGGFSRYSVDERWHVPHFEKMLYDNAQLVSLYSHAHAVTKNPLYATVVHETLRYIKNEMTHPNGAFYSSLDADSKTETGKLEEGAYYRFTKEEIQQIIDETDSELFKAYFNINDFGKWEENYYVPVRNKDDAFFLKEYNITENHLNERKAKWKEQLAAHRNKREKPRLDDKSLTSWNALMLKGYVDAYKVFQKEAYLEAALKNAAFLRNNQLRPDGALWHTHKDGKSNINGYLEDYAAVVQAFIALHEATLDTQWLDTARELTEYAYTHFYDEEKSMFYFTSNEDTKLITRTIDYRDNVIPASNSIMAKNLFVLSHHFAVPKYAGTARQMLNNVLPEMVQYPTAFSNWADLLGNYKNNYYEIVAVGPAASAKIAELNKTYLPNALVTGSTKESKRYLLQGRYPNNKTLIYVCVNNACKLPVTTVAQAMELLQ
ncbi:MAG: thioredoxin domain-containing protein, partial [Marinirhabdus sp.]